MNCNNPVDKGSTLFKGNFLVFKERCFRITLVEEILVPDAILPVDGCDLVKKSLNVPFDFLWPFKDVGVGYHGQGVFHDLVEIGHLRSR